MYTLGIGTQTCVTYIQPITKYDVDRERIKKHTISRDKA